MPGTGSCFLKALCCAVLAIIEVSMTSAAIATGLGDSRPLKPGPARWRMSRASTVRRVP